MRAAPGLHAKTADDVASEVFNVGFGSGKKNRFHALIA